MTDMSNRTNRFRRKRTIQFLGLVDQVAQAGRPVRILDLGGTEGYWRTLSDIFGDRAIEFTIVNLGANEYSSDNFRILNGNACDLPMFPDNHFDIVHSNSVIEHVGRWSEMKSMAMEVRRLAPCYFVQTPNMWFPIEPHFQLPFVHWLPEQARAKILSAPKGRFLPVGSKYDDAINMVQRVNLLTGSQMRHLFPDAKILRERFLGLTKSWIAIRGPARG
jgi:hypothetical protein